MGTRVLVIPEYNESKTIIEVLSTALPYVDKIIVVNDGSHDNSAALVSQWAVDRPEVTLLSLPLNTGMSGALLCGFAYAYHLLQAGHLEPDDLIITIDADGQHRPEEIPDACEVLAANGLDVLLGKRTLQGYPWFKHIGNWGLSLWASLLSGYRYHDVECGFRVMRAAVLSELLTYFLGRRYSCAQEIGIITAARKLKVANQFPSGIRYYRDGAKVRDGITNLVMGLMAAMRVWMGIRFSPSDRTHTVLAGVHQTTTSDSWKAV